MIHLRFGTDHPYRVAAVIHVSSYSKGYFFPRTHDDTGTVLRVRGLDYKTSLLDSVLIRGSFVVGIACYWTAGVDWLGARE